jgi:hypothetical protein
MPKAALRAALQRSSERSEAIFWGRFFLKSGSVSLFWGDFSKKSQFKCN